MKPYVAIIGMAASLLAGAVAIAAIAALIVRSFVRGFEGLSGY